MNAAFGYGPVSRCEQMWLAMRRKVASPVVRPTPLVRYLDRPRQEASVAGERVVGHQTVSTEGRRGSLRLVVLCQEVLFLTTRPSGTLVGRQPL